MFPFSHHLLITEFYKEGIARSPTCQAAVCWRVKCTQGFISGISDAECDNCAVKRWWQYSLSPERLSIFRRHKKMTRGTMLRTKSFSFTWMWHIQVLFMKFTRTWAMRCLNYASGLYQGWPCPTRPKALVAGAVQVGGVAGLKPMRQNSPPPPASSLVLSQELSTGRKMKACWTTGSGELQEWEACPSLLHLCAHMYSEMRWKTETFLSA